MAQENTEAPAAPASDGSGTPPPAADQSPAPPAGELEQRVEAAVQRALASRFPRFPGPAELRIGRMVHHATRRARAQGAPACEVAHVATVHAGREDLVDLAVWSSGEWQDLRLVEHGADRGEWHWPAECKRGL